MDVTIIALYKDCKRGNQMNEYEDSFSISEDSLKVSVADGATEASFSKEWSQILTKHYISNPIEIITNEWLNLAYDEFYKNIDIGRLPWHAQNKIIEQGSYSTLTGISIDQEAESFTGIVIGDSCIFWIDNEGMHKFPFRSEQEFNSRPYLINTLKQNNEEIEDEKNQKILPYFKFSEGSTRIYLATDALSCWIVSEDCKGNKPCEILDGLDNEQEFVKFVDNLRDNGELKNDDVTLVILEIMK